MNEDKLTRNESDDDHEGRVEEAFDAFHADVAHRASEEEKDRLEKMKAAVVRKDAGEVQEHLSFIKDAHSWLYREMTGHPKLATLIDELALWGF